MNNPSPLLFVCNYAMFTHAMVLVSRGEVHLSRGSLDHMGVYKSRWRQTFSLIENPELKALYQGNCWNLEELYAFVVEFCGEQADAVTDEREVVMS